MKTIGMIGGMSWESTALYYRLINQLTKARLGGHHNARSLLVTVDFDDVERLQHSGDWDALGRLMAGCAQQLERAGADFIVLCTNAMHKLADCIETAVGIPLLHIAEATADAVETAGEKRVALLGTKFTMEQTFFSERLEQRAIDVLIPDAPSREMIHQVIYGELVHGHVREESRKKFLRVIDELSQRGAQSVILGCTEIGLLIRQEDTPLPLHDTTVVHATAAIDLALS